MIPPAVSVCLPVYNGERFLSAAIESVLGQTFDDFELVVVDDNSSDRSAEITADFACRDSRVRLYHNDTNLGLFFNYNKCMELSAGRYIKPFAQDDLLCQSALARMVQELDTRDNVSLVACTREYVDAQGQSVEIQRCFEKDQECDGQIQAVQMLSNISNQIGEPCAVMYRAEHKGTGFAAELPQLGDIEYWVRLLQQGRLFFISDVLCKFRLHSGNQTRKNIASFDYFADMMIVKERYGEFLAQCGISNEEFTRRILLKVTELIHYADGIGIDFSRSDFSALSRRPQELGQLLVDLLQRLAAIEPEYLSLRSRLPVLEEGNSRLHGELSSLVNSPSWRLTAGLRNLKRITAALLGAGSK